MLEGDERTFQQQKHDPNKIMKQSEEEWDQSYLRLANYAQNNDQRFLLKSPTDLSGLGTGHTENFPKFKSFFPHLNLELRGTKIDEIWTQESPQHKEYISNRVFFLILKISLSILD
jgi:hypothetical protein